MPTTLIPCPLCDALPFSEPTELADHLAAGCAGFGTATGPAPAPLVPAPPAPALDAVRSFSPGGTRARTSRPAQPCSDKQANFIRNLVDQKGGELPDFDTLSKREASDMIERLLAAPNKQGASTSKGPAPEGFHIHDGSIYKVQTSKTGNRYCKRLIVDDDGDGTWDYAGARPLANLSEDTLATLEEAQAFGLRYGICMCCGRVLTNPESIERGIGPICAGKHFAA